MIPGKHCLDVLPVPGGMSSFQYAPGCGFVEGHEIVCRVGAHPGYAIGEEFADVDSAVADAIAGARDTMAEARLQQANPWVLLDLL